VCARKPVDGRRESETFRRMDVPNGGHRATRKNLPKATQELISRLHLARNRPLHIGVRVKLLIGLV
jgi:hypothetical protein